MHSADFKVVRYGRSRSLKVIEIGIKRKPVCDFLLVFHSSFIPIFYSFRDITISWSKSMVSHRFAARCYV